MIMSKKVILITGCSSGLGLEASILCAQNGHQVIATMRNLERSAHIKEKIQGKKLNLVLKQCDVNDQASVDSCIQESIKEFGRLDVLINNAGYGLISPLETIELAEARAQFETNFFGVVRMVQAVLPLMRRQKSGKIINVSSVAGIIGSPLFGIYSATKFALEGLSESLAQEVSKFGIQVKLIEPGGVHTEFGSKTNLRTGTKKDGTIPEYARMQKSILEYYAHQDIFPDVQKAEDAAKVYLEAVEDDSNTFRYQTSKQAQVLAQKKLKDIKSL